MTKLDELTAMNPDIARFVADYYAALDPATPLLSVLSPHALAHQVAANYPGLGAACCLLVAEAAREVLIGGTEPPAPALPHVTSALGGLIGSKDSSWF